jgi:hypothetical protein
MNTNPNQSFSYPSMSPLMGGGGGGNIQSILGLLQSLMQMKNQKPAQNQSGSYTNTGSYIPPFSNRHPFQPNNGAATNGNNFSPVAPAPPTSGWQHNTVFDSDITGDGSTATDPINFGGGS